MVFSVSGLAWNRSVTGSLDYRIAMPSPHTHYFEVEIELKNFRGDDVDFNLPVWTPGSYLVREFAKNIEGFSVSTKDGKSLGFDKINKNTWRISAKDVDHLIVKYRVYAFDGYIRMSYLDEDHALIMANSLLMYVDDLKDQSSVLYLSYPSSWNSISTSLTALKDNEKAFYVPNYDILIDSPIEIGNHQIIEFTAAGVPHEVAMVGRVMFDKDQLVRDLKKIIKSATAVFGENPNEKYTFIVQTDQRAGGLEHMSSTVLGVSRWTFTNPQKYNYFLSLVAHEYFHLWMVKRLKPVELEIFDYSNEVYTDLLWVMEGFTSYFEEKIMLSCGYYSEQKFLNNLLSAMTNIQNTPGAKEQSVAEASFDAWIKFYRKDENSINSQISYYQKGMALGALLDLEVIAGSEGEKRLDDVVSQLYHQFYKKRNKGITSDDLQKALERASHQNLDEFFKDYVTGTKDLDNAKYLDLAGIKLIETNKSTTSKSLGITFETYGDNLIVKSVVKGSAGYDHGISAGDELISMNGYRINRSNIKVILNHYKAGDKVNILLSRKGLMVEKEIIIRKDSSVHYTYQVVKNPSKRQVKVYEAWLKK